MHQLKIEAEKSRENLAGQKPRLKIKIKHVTFYVKVVFKNPR
jgi:hypothetical protein